MKSEINPMVAIGAVVALVAVIALVLFLRSNPGQDANAVKRNNQLVGQMRQTGATAGTPTGGAAPPQAMRMMQGGGMQGGGMQPGR